MTFISDLKFGQYYEALASQYYNNIGYNIIIESDNKKEYDFIIENDKKETFKIEVKADRNAFKTNNICIEFMCSCVNSGINSTTAIFWVYYVIKHNKDNYNMYIIPTKYIKELIKNKKYHKIIKPRYGKSKCYLFKIELFNNFLKKVSEEKEEKEEKIIKKAKIN